jgi:BASS family bile acid:Na+ symporter
MQFILTIGLPLLVIFAMTVVGLELTPADFTNVRRHPRAILLALFAQWVMLPLAAVVLARGMALSPSMAVGLLLIAAAPVAALSNYYALLARARLAISVTITAVSSIAATITLPVVLALSFRLLRLESAEIELPLAKILQQMIVGLLLPVAFGMAIRRIAPGWVKRWQRTLLGLSLVALAAIVGFIVVDQLALIRAELPILIAASLAFTVLTLAMGWLLCQFATAEPDNRRALLFGFPARNISIATLVAVGAFGRTDFASFGAVLFLVQATVLVPLALAFSGYRALAAGAPK